MYNSLCTHYYTSYPITSMLKGGNYLIGQINISRTLFAILLIVLLVVLILIGLLVVVPAKKNLKKASESVRSSYDDLLHNENLIKLVSESSQMLITSKDADKSLLWILENLQKSLSTCVSFLFFNDENSSKDNPYAFKKFIVKDPNLTFSPEIEVIDHFSYYDNDLMEIYNILDSGSYVSININELNNKEIINILKSSGIFSFILIPIKSEDSFIGFMGFGTCIENRTWSSTEINVLQTIASAIELEYSKEQAIEASKSKSNFLANMSHEIRNPLNAILGIASILTEEDLNSETKKYVRILRDSGNSLLKIINNILDISKIEAGKIDLQISTFDLKATIKETTYLFRESYKDKDVTIQYFVDDALPEKLTGYGVGVNQIITNLTSNALKFTHKGYVNIIAKVENIDKDDISVLISVEDSGIGISEEDLKKIFSSYTQASSTIKKVYAGTGLGLAISKSLVEFMGCNLMVESELDKGSKFFFYLNLKIPPEITNVPEPETAVYPENKLLNDEPIRILLADDSQDNRFLIELYLKKYNCSLVTAENGKEAVEKFKNDTFDIILMDIQMPIMDGYAAVKEIREYEKQHIMNSIPIIALTSHAFKDEVELILGSGFTVHLAKPISKITLVNTLDMFNNMRMGLR